MGLLAIAALIGISIALLAPPRVLDSVSQELIALAGLLMAAVLPTMVLTATVLRAGALPVARIIEYRDALMRQARLWGGLFLVALLACCAVVLGKAWGWRYADAGGATPTETQIAIARAITGAVAFLLSLLVLRAYAVFEGIISLIRLSADIAIGEAQDRVDRDAAPILAELASRREAGFGEYVDLPRH